MENETGNMEAPVNGGHDTTPSACKYQYPTSSSFWQAGEFLPETDAASVQRNEKPGLDHARLHPRFLHSNATSHKWALGALVELLDNSMDEVSAGCTYVSVDKVNHPVDGPQNPMLLVEDNGGGMDAPTIRNCMSFGFSLKHGKKMIGQYGNGFKTSTMRLGADAMVLTKSASAQSCSVGLLSYSFLTETNSQDVVVPIVDYNLQQRTRMTRGDENEWKSKLDMICEWGPFASESDVWQQLDSMPSQGTRVYIWNLWQTSDNLPELDFISDVNDILLRGHEDDVPEASGRKKKSDEGMKRCHSYRHSLRSYVSMLYLQWPESFQILVRNKEVVPVPVTAGMKHIATYDYKPRSLPKDDAGSAQSKGPVVVPVYIGFAVEAPDTSVSGFCVYHRNRLIKPFWKVYTSASSVGRGVIGFLQDFENTPPLQKLEKYLKRQVPHYWRTKSHLVGYQDHLTSLKADTTPQEETPNKNDTPAPHAPSAKPDEAVEVDEGTPAPMGAKEMQETPKKTPVTPRKASVHSDPPRASLHFVEDVSVRAPQKKPAKCLQEMQQHISQLQQSVQEFCNSYEIKEDAQLVLGRIFGTTMSRVLDPARELKRMCAIQIKGHRQALLFIAKSKTEGKLVGPIPQFIQAEMKAMGLNLSDALETEDEGSYMEAPMNLDMTAATNGQPQLQRRSGDDREETGWQGKRKATGADTPDTVEQDLEPTSKTGRGEETAEEELHLTGPMEIDISSSQWVQTSNPATETPHDGFGRRSSQSANDDLAQLGLSVVEKFLKTKPPKLGVVQLAPNSQDVHKRGFVSGSNEDPLEVVNLSDEIHLTTEPSAKRMKSRSPESEAVHAEPLNGEETTAQQITAAPVEKE